MMTKKQTLKNSFLILAFCLLFPKGVKKDVKVFIFLVFVLDLIHYLLISKVNFGLHKIGLAIIIWGVYLKFRKC